MFESINFKGILFLFCRNQKFDAAEKNVQPEIYAKFRMVQEMNWRVLNEIHRMEQEKKASAWILEQFRNWERVKVVAAYTRYTATQIKVEK